MEIRWITGLAVISSAFIFGSQQAGLPTIIQNDGKQKDVNAKPAPRIELKIPDGVYAPRIVPLKTQPIPLDKIGRPDMQAFEAQRNERLKSGDLALEYKYNMPIKVPDPNVDYKIQIIRPNPDIEHKMQLIDPGESAQNQIRLFEAPKVLKTAPSSKVPNKTEDAKKVPAPQFGGKK